MSTTHNEVGQVPSDNRSATYSSRVPRIFWGYHYFNKRGKPGIAKAGLILAFVFMGFSVLIMVASLVLIAALNGGAGSPNAGSNVPATQQTPAVQQPATTGVQPGSLTGPGTTSTPVQIARQIANIRREAFCTGGAKGQAMLDQVWESHANPKPLPYELQDAQNPNALALTQPHSTYAADSQEMRISDTEGSYGANCNFVRPASEMTVTESYPVSNTTWVICSVFLTPVEQRLVDGYTAVYDLVDGHWLINQMH